ncbi:cyclic GMP-AMP synthase DncV-like nucleotidyltransferase [Mucilaginibacter sp. E4BP6]|uniref:cyclic GMP-AMP synthase DncV-like nucleotidyltransferase n=1 Tax=Mucilaginibacter sp. E4BP6 TaxID=2723089 RepID=UPI0015CBBF2B|nr:hypothetical protein [Mucilaginibacter sp. E4BP6]NYE66042.1 hypothetical protein [Mucilaginibacter sp. E4BP6]
MANCHKLFLDYNKEITPTATQRQKMKTSRQLLEVKIANTLFEKLGMRVTFYTQGSDAHKMKTIIIKEDGSFDSDRGVYLLSKPSVSGETVQGYIRDAVKDHTKEGAQHRKKCVRVIFQCEYNIDFPAYYEIADEDFAYMAVKGQDWTKDDPWHMITWLEKYKDSNGQYIRMIKYLKGWTSKRKANGKMPSGIALAVWTARHFSIDAENDDKCLLKLLNAIKSAVQYSVTCYAPVEPFDDLTAKLTKVQKDNFIEELKMFCDHAQKAIDETDQLKASKIWRKYLGDRFPEGLNEEDEKRAEKLLASASTVASGAYLGRSGSINSISGTPHLGHRNYGG